MNNTLYVVMENSDFTEGRGPMLLHSIWSDPKEAISWVSKQSGIFGTEQRIERGKYGYYAYANGYQIEEFSLIDCESEMERQKARQKALSKLTAEDRAILGV